MDSIPQNFQIRVPRLPADSPILKEILRDFYGIEFLANPPTLLAGYDDLNFKLERENGEMRTLKFSNYWEARFYPKLCDAQIELASLLAKNGLECPQLVGQKNGEKHSLVRLEGQKDVRLNPVRMFTFIPGQTLGDWLEADKFQRFQPKILDYLAQQIGHLLGQFHSILDNFEFCPPIFREYSPLISLECWPILRREFGLQKAEMPELMDEKNAKLCEQIFDQFERQILSKRENFIQGLIHSDLNESNILLIPGPDPTPQICGLLDFGDAHFSFRLADFANAILYFYLLLREHFPSDPGFEMLKRISERLFCGYSSANPHSPFLSLDFSHLCLFIRARLVSSLVYGLRTYRMEKIGGNEPKGMEYVMQTQKRGWAILEELAMEKWE